MIRTGAIEDIFHPWVSFLPTDNPRVAEVTTDTVEPEAYSKWGKPGDFDFSSIPSNGFQVQNSNDTARDRYNYSEEGRGYTDYKVKNASDPSQYVIVRRVQTISFNGPGGAQFTLHLANDTNGSKEGSGQNPSSPELSKL